MSTETETAPRVWIGCLASYNAGRLIGKWTDATDLDELNECRDRVAAEAVAAAKEAGEYPVYFGEPEEFFLADREGFGDLIGEYTPFEQVAELGQAIEEHGAAFLAYASYQGADDWNGDSVAEKVEQFEEARAGEFDSMKEFAEDYVAEAGWAGMSPVPDEMFAYLDFEMIARELEMDFYMVDGYVFRSNV